MSTSITDVGTARSRPRATRSPTDDLRRIDPLSNSLTGMPRTDEGRTPLPFEYKGGDLVARFCGSIFSAGRRFDLVLTRANRQPAFGAYLRAPNGISHGMGLYVLTPKIQWRTDLHRDPVREHRPSMVQVTAIAPEPITAFEQ